MFSDLLTFVADDLIEGIQGDIKYAEEQLDLPHNLQYKTSQYFSTTKADGANIVRSII